MGNFSPFGKVMVVLILGPPALFLLAVLVFVPVFYFDLIPCTWDVPMIGKLPRDAKVLSCEEYGLDGYAFTAELSRDEFLAFAQELGTAPDNDDAKAGKASGQTLAPAHDEGEISFSRTTTYDTLDLSWKAGVLSAEYFED